MAAWDPNRYLRFDAERTRPCRDLADRVDLPDPKVVVDLGCGPGNSTAILRARWPNTRLIGVDSSAEMLRAARASGVPAEWQEARIEGWEPPSPPDLIFSNAAFQWVPGHLDQMARLLGRLAPGGAIAVQVPANDADVSHAALRAVVSRDEWTAQLGPVSRGEDVPTLKVYYDRLTDLCARLNLWETQYLHVLNAPEAVVEWTRSTMLRPWLAALGDGSNSERFLAEYAFEIAARYPRHPDGRVLFPFLRRFVIAYRR
jgi:trans-aconitate 2-methyltransferase